MKAIKELLVLAKMEEKGYFKNSTEFAQKKYDEYVAKINSNANMVYNAYLPKGEKIAEERKNLYIQTNLKLTINDFK